MDIHTCGERRPSMYRQWMNERLRNEERENGEKEKREGASLGARQSVMDPCPARVSPTPLNNPSPRGRPAKWTHTHTKKKANRRSFLFDFKIPGMKEEGASWSWCQARLAPSLEELAPVTAPSPIYVCYRHCGLEQP